MNLNYTTILVKDMEESINFYVNNLGFEIENQIKSSDKIITFLKSKNSSGIELIKENNSEIGLYGIVFEVKDVSKEVQRLKEDKPNLEVIINQTPNNTLAFIKDPNGVNIILSR